MYPFYGLENGISYVTPRAVIDELSVGGSFSLQRACLAGPALSSANALMYKRARGTKRHAAPCNQHRSTNQRRWATYLAFDLLPALIVCLLVEHFPTLQLVRMVCNLLLVLEEAAFVLVGNATTSVFHCCSSAMHHRETEIFQPPRAKQLAFQPKTKPYLWDLVDVDRRLCMLISSMPFGAGVFLDVYSCFLQHLYCFEIPGMRRITRYATIQGSGSRSTGPKT